MTSIDSLHLMVVLVCGMITYAIRVSFVGRKKVVKFSKLSKLILNHIPTACFSALIVSTLVVTPNGLDINSDKIIACLIALFFGIWLKNFMVVIIVGMVSFWLIRLIA